MPIIELSYLDIGLLGFDLFFIIVTTLFTFDEGTSFRKCNKIEISDENLRNWRYHLYGSVYSTWLAVFLTYIYPTTLRILFHGYFVIAVCYNLKISVPAWVCKRFGYGGTCNCDFYEYNDFYPMIILGLIGALILSIFDLNHIQGIYVLFILLLISILTFYILPKKEIERLKYNQNLLIKNVDDLQEFLMNDPQNKKLITILNASCDFCEIQVNEIQRADNELIKNRLRIHDLTFEHQIDPLISITLNLDTETKIPVPTTIIFDSGMAVEQKDGVLSTPEIEMLLTS